MANLEPKLVALKDKEAAMTCLTSAPRNLSYLVEQDGQHTDRRRGWKRFSRVLAVFLALAVIAVASPAQFPRPRSEARERISELERLRRQRGVKGPDFRKNMERVQREFGVVSRPLPTPRPLAMPFSLRSEQSLGFSLDRQSQNARIRKPKLGSAN